MKLSLIIAGVLSALLLFTAAISVHAATPPLTTRQGGTGVSDVASGSILFGSVYNIRQATSSALQFNNAASRLSATYASSTAFSATTICLTGDTCRTTWPAAGTTYTATYPVQIAGTVISLAFGTTTSNTWAGTQTFTNAPVFSSLTGLLKGNGASAVTAAANGTDYTLITAKTCSAGDFVSAVTAAGVFTCTTPAGTTYTGTYPIQVSGSVISTAFGTTTNTGIVAGNLYIGSGGLLQTTASSSIFGYTPLNPTRSLTVAGTANQITSSAGAQDLSADRTWTLSLPNHVIFPVDFVASAGSTTNATTTGSQYFGFLTGNAQSCLFVDTNGKLQGTGVACGTGGGGITSLGPTGQTQTGPTITIASTTLTLNGQTHGIQIVGSGNTLTFTPTLTGTLTVGGGGTGIASYTPGDILYADTASTLARVASTTDGFVLSLANGKPTWVATTTLSTITGTLSVAKGGTNVTSFTGNRLVLSDNAGTSLVSAAATSTPTVTAPITYSGTLGSFVGGAAGTFGCTNASAGVTGCLTGTDWSTFNNKQPTISVTWPITLAGATVGFGGLGTTTNLTQGQLPYVTGVNTFGQVATTSVTCAGTVSCSSFTAIGASPITLTGSSSISPYEIATTSSIAVPQLAYFTQTSGRTTLGGVGTTSATINNGLTGTLTTIGGSQTIGLATINAGVLGSPVNGAVPTSQATSTLYGLGTNGFVLAEVAGVPTWVATTTLSTISGTLNLASQVTGTLPIANGGTGTTTTQKSRVYYGGGDGLSFQSVATTSVSCTGASGISCTSFDVLTGGGAISLSGIPNSSLTNSTISGVALGGTLGALSATNGTLTFSGSYTGAAAQTIGLNLANANTWTALQQFSANASSSQESVFSKLYVGGTATTTIDIAGNIVIPSGSSLTNTGVSNGCATWATGVLGSTGVACGSGGSGIGDPFTHPAAGQSATTSLMQFFGQASTSQFTATSSVYLASSAGGVNIGTTTNFGKALFVEGAISGGVAVIQRDFNAAPANSVIGTYDVRLNETGAGSLANLTGPAQTFGVELAGGTENIQADISTFRDGADNSGGLELRTYNAGSPARAFTIDHLQNIYMAEAPGTGWVGIGSSTLSAKLSVHLNSNETTPLAFAIGSSTASATTTLFSVSNTGNVSLAGRLTVLGDFVLTAVSSLVTSATNMLGIDTTTGQLRWFDGTNTHVALDEYQVGTFLASSTLSYLGTGASATSTIRLYNPRYAATTTSIYCKTNTGTYGLQVGHGTASTTYMTCNSSGVELTTYPSGSFTAREDVWLGIGTLTGTPTGLTVTVTQAKIPD